LPTSRATFSAAKRPPYTANSHRLARIGAALWLSATGVENVEGGIHTTVLGSDGVESTIRSRWLIAADGGRSEVRQNLGIGTDKPSTRGGV